MTRLQRIPKTGATDAELDVMDAPLQGSRHERDHEMICKSISEDSAAASKLLVHLAREHNWGVEDIDNAGLAILIHEHDRAHGDATSPRQSRHPQQWPAPRARIIDRALACRW